MHRIPPELTVQIPDDRIARRPAERRDASRLLVYDRFKREVVHVGVFPDVARFIAGDLLILNDTRVLPAQVDGRKPGGGAVEVLFLGNEREVLITPSRRLRPGLVIEFAKGGMFTLKSKSEDGRWLGDWVNREGLRFEEWLRSVGKAPLPPYIRRKPEPGDLDRYQTVYAETPGSVAAPTAGLHFTRELLKQLELGGCDPVWITLDVGPGTFIPIREDDLRNHKMHRESWRIPQRTAEAINRAKSNKRSVTAVGTTVVRTLESAALTNLTLRSGKGVADLFIYPPFAFQIVDRLLTNFHRPDSTLIQLLAALIGWEAVNLCYRTALDKGFRFYSYGDAMLVI